MAEDKTKLTAMYRRWAYMAVAIIAAFLLTTGPSFTFLQDKGILYIRSFAMNQESFVVTQTELENGVEHVTGMMSVKGLYYCYLVMLYSCIAALLMMIHTRARLLLCDVAIVASAAYYLLLVIYSMRISDIHFATMAPTWRLFLPAIVLEMMALTHRNVMKYGHYMDDADDE